MAIRLGFDNSTKNEGNDCNSNHGPVFDSMTQAQRPIRDTYNFGKYGEKPYLPEYERRRRADFSAEFYDPDYKLFIKSLIDDIIGLHKPVSGYVLKLIFDEYQRGKTTSDIYTNFYTNYVNGKNVDNHCNIANNNLYLLFVNNWGDIIPRKVIKESDIVLPILQSLDKDNTISETESYARSIAIRLHNKVPNDNWDEEFDETKNHIWTKPIHTKYLLIAKDIINWTRFNSNNIETEDEGY